MLTMPTKVGLIPRSSLPTTGLLTCLPTQGAIEQLSPRTVCGEEAWVSTVTRLIVPADRVWTDNLYGLPQIRCSHIARAPRTGRSTTRPRPHHPASRSERRRIRLQLDVALAGGGCAALVTFHTACIPGLLC